MPPRDDILVGGIKLQLATGPKGERAWTVTQRPSQPDDVGALKVAEWAVDGHDFNATEQIGPGQEAGYLGRDYGNGTDGRWQGVDTLGPLLNALTLTTYDLAWNPSVPSSGTFVPGVNLIPGGAPASSGAAGYATGMAWDYGPSGVPYGYIIRGQQLLAKVNLSTMTLVAQNELPIEAPTSILATRAANAAREISTGFEASAYRVLTAIAVPPNSDTWVTNSAGQKARILGVAPDRIVAEDQSTLQVLGNVMTGAVTMAAPSWSTVSTLNAFERLRFNGFNLEGSLWVIGTSNGPYVLDFDTREFTPLIDEIDNDDRNGRLAHWSYGGIGTIVLLRDGSYSLGSAASIGPEIFENNQSIVQGRPGAFGGSTHWLYATYYNATEGDAYLLAGRPREAGDHHGHPISWHTIGVIAQEALFLSVLGTLNGTRTNPTVILGNGPDAVWFTVGLTAREIDDTGYRYAAAGTTYLTEMRRARGTLNDVEAVEFEVGGTASAGKTVTVSLSLDGGSYQSFTALTSTGFKRQLAVSSGIPDSAMQSWHRIKPKIAYATDSSSAAPQVKGTLRLFYRARPLTIRVFTITVKLPATTGRNTAEGLEEELRAFERTGTPIAVQGIDRDLDYMRVIKVDVKEVQDRGGGADSARGSERIAVLTLEEWPVA